MPSVFPSGEPGVSGDFWGSQEGCQGPFRPSGRNRQVALERTVQLNVSCECGGAAGSLRAVVCVWVCACVCVCREKASLLVYGPAPWELRWGVAVKDSSPIPGFPPGVLVSFHPTPPSAASPCLSAPDAPRNLRISLAFRNVTGRTGPLLSRAGSCSWDCLQDGAGEWA